MYYIIKYQGFHLLYFPFSSLLILPSLLPEPLCLTNISFVLQSHIVQHLGAALTRPGCKQGVDLIDFVRGSFTNGRKPCYDRWMNVGNAALLVPDGDKMYLESQSTPKCKKKNGLTGNFSVLVFGSAYVLLALQLITTITTCKSQL